MAEMEGFELLLRSQLGAKKLNYLQKSIHLYQQCIIIILISDSSKGENKGERYIVYAYKFSKILGLSTLLFWLSHGSLNIVIQRKEGDTMKRVMLLASNNICDIVQTELDNKYIILPCSDPVTGADLLETKPDALIISLSLAGFNGMTFLHSHTDHLPPITLVLTPFISDALLADLSTLGVSYVSLIPCRLSCLRNTLASFL